MTEYGCDILKHGVVDLPTIYRKHFGSYEWDKAMRRTVQLPVVIFCVQLGGSGNKISYVTNFQVNIDYKKYVDWYGRMFSISNKEKFQLNSSQLKAICKLATTESGQLLIKYAVCESSGLSVKKAIWH